VSFTVKTVRSSDKGQTVRIDAIREGSDERVTYNVSEGTYREIGCPLSGEIISGEELERLIREDSYRRALKKSLSLLSYADNNKRTLFTKLMRAGFKREVAEEAVKEMVRLGYINEDRQLERLVTSRALRDLLGPHKIEAKLLAKGYSLSRIRGTLDSLTGTGEIDFSQTKKALIKKRLGDNYTQEEKLKILYKYGYCND